MKILVIVGTRPEAIKMAPVILELRSQSWADVTVVATAQHREILDQVLSGFDIRPDIDLNVMRPHQSLNDLTARLLSSLGDVIDKEKPNATLAQGDTTTVMASALTCFYHKIPFGHVEAGLRTGDFQYPFPEEANRVLTSVLATWHFAPTENARRNLINSGVDRKSIHLTGNTVIDALLSTAAARPLLGIDIDPQHRLVLVTAHRRENFGDPLRNVCLALQELSYANPDVTFLYPVHPNPNVKGVVESILADCSNCLLCDPLGYGQFVAAMKRARIILTDSGGIQEEAPALGVPVLVLRNETERPEAVESGVVRLVGTEKASIIDETQRLLDNPKEWSDMARGASPYGDGTSAKKIVSVLRKYFGK